MTSSSFLTWLEITDTQKSPNIRHDFLERILDRSQAIFCNSSRSHASRPACLTSSSNLSFNCSHTATRRIPIVRRSREIPEEITFQEKRSFSTSFVSFHLSSDRNVSAVSAMPPTGSSASWQQRHLPHSS